MKVGFFTYGDVEMGMGHVYRCLRFAEYLKRKKSVEIVFEVFDSPEVKSVFAGYSDGTVRYHVAGALPSGPWDLLIVDQLQVRPEVMRRLKVGAKRLVSFDDIGPGRFEADLAFNALYECVVPRPATSTTKSYEGLEYLLLDPAFSGRSSAPANLVTDILVTQGGSDTYQLVPRVVQRLRETLDPKIRIHALLGSGARHGSAYEQILRGLLPATQVHKGIGDVPDFFSRFDLAVTSIGMSAFELAALGKPIVMFTGERKELETGMLIRRLAGAPLCDLASESAEAQAARYVGELVQDFVTRQKLSQKLSELVDARGFERITHVLFEN